MSYNLNSDLTDSFKYKITNASEQITTWDNSNSTSNTLMLSGSDDDATHYFYGIINDNDAAIKLSEVNLMATITTDLANGIEGYSPNNFLF